MKRPRAFANLCALVAISTAGASAAVSEPDVVMGTYGGDSPPHVMFIAAKELDRLKSSSPAQGQTTLGYSPSALIEQVNKAKQIYQKDGCTQPLRGDDILGGGPSASELTEYVFRRQPIGVLARVIETKPGWMPLPLLPPQGLVGTLVTAVVTDVLNGRTTMMRAGSTVSFIEWAGEFKFESTLFCTRDPEIVPLAVGDEIAIAGAPSEVQGPEVLAGGYVLVVRDGKGYPTRPSVKGVKQEPADVLDLRRYALEGPQSAGPN